MFSEILDRWTRTQDGNLKLLPFHPYPKASNRSAWNRIPSSVKTRLIKKGEDFLHFQYPALSATDFMDFVRTGNRERYQERLFNRRLAFNHLVLAECAEHEGRFMDDIVNGFFCICEESAWQLPAHNSYIRDTPQFILPDVNRPVVDLFAAETGAILSTAACLLQDELNLISPSILGMVQSNLETRIFKPYLTEHFWWMGDGKSHMNNWTVWCTQNILLTAALSDISEEVRRAVFLKACESLDYFLAEYGEDGCCDEGAQYFHHAGLCLFGCMEILNAITDGHFHALYEEPKIKNIASYIVQVHAAGPYYINFADCSPIAGQCGAREYLFGKRTANPRLMGLAAGDFRQSQDPLLREEHNLFYRLQTIFSAQEMTDYVTAAPTTGDDIYYPSTGLFIVRDSRFCLAVKAGDNDDSHNHNDTGSFTIYRNGQPLFADIGVETYQKKTFSEERYSIWTMQSQYHNLLSFAGCDESAAISLPYGYAVNFGSANSESGAPAIAAMQHNGPQYRANDVRWQLTDTFGEISMELADAYPEQRVSSYVRTVRLDKEKGITITDVTSCDSLQPVLSLITSEEPFWKGETSELLIPNSGAASVLPESQTEDSLCVCKIQGAAKVIKERLPITDNRLKTAWKQDMWRTLIYLQSNQCSLNIR